MPLSYARGPEVRLLEWTLFEALEERRRGNPRGEALVVRHEGRRWTWEALAEEVERTARGLVGLGLRPGDRVGMWATNCSEWVLLQLACARTGVVLVNVNPAYRASELAYVLRKSHMKVIFLREADARTSYRATLEDTGRSVRSVFLGTEDWEEMLANGREVKDVAVSPYDVANIQYTSGTTGSPKGVLLTHHNILNNGLLIGRMLRATEADRICVPVPMYHCFGCVGGTCVSLTTGAPMILPSATFEAGAVLEAIAEERATAIYGVPTMFIAMLEHAGFAGFDLTSLRTGIMAGS
ncbi:MAG: AMP-binding protein, partial [Bryobacteraceae bacterium]|nr:AMP-binding protein [Bryobacteraceae bacterium]